MMKNKKKIGIAGGAAAVVAAVVIAFTGGSQDIDVEYSLSKKNEYVTVMEIQTPDEAKIDIAELYLNGELVDKTLMPKGKFESIPLVFDDMSRLELKLYRLGECVGEVNLGEGTVKGDA